MARKNYLAIALLIFGFNALAQDCEIKTKGAYVYSSAEEQNAEREFNEFIRFYEDGEVITAISIYDLKQSANWFNKKDDQVSTGSYEQDGCNITFSTRGITGKYYYEGTIEDSYLKLKVLYPGKKKKQMVELEFHHENVTLK